MTREQMTDRAVRLPAALLKTEAGQAAVAQAWVEGLKQKEIAKVFGIKGPAKVCLAILSLIQKYCPEDCRVSRQLCGGRWAPRRVGEFRKAIAHDAVTRYLNRHRECPWPAHA